MKGFGIYVKNDLLEPKHVKQMGEAVWLYMWLLDKMTTVNENGEGRVLGNKPIKFADVEHDLGVSRFAYVRWVDKLRNAGYINTLRTPSGLVITVTKAKKGKAEKAKSDVPKSHITRNSDVAQTHSDVAYSHSDVSKSHIQYKTKQGLNKTKQITTNVVGETPQVFGKPEINELFDYWLEMTGNPITAQQTANRRAASNLLKKHGRDAVRKMIGGVAYSHGQRYAPSIANFSQLQSKWDELIVWGKRQKSDNGKGKIYKI